MSAFAEITLHLDPGGIIAWLAVGLIAGWLAGKVMKGAGYGLIGDIVMGLVCRHWRLSLRLLCYR